MLHSCCCLESKCGKELQQRYWLMQFSIVLSLTGSSTMIPYPFKLIPFKLLIYKNIQSAAFLCLQLGPASICPNNLQGGKVLQEQEGRRMFKCHCHGSWMILDVTWLVTAVYSGHPFKDTALQFKKKELP